jgi:hypothetical protein
MCAQSAYSSDPDALFSRTHEACRQARELCKRANQVREESRHLRVHWRSVKESSEHTHRTAAGSRERVHELREHT